MSGIRDINRDEDVSGQIVGGEYVQGAVYYDGRKQGRCLYGRTDEELRRQADAFIAEKREECGQAFAMIWPKPLWELRIAA